MFKFILSEYFGACVHEPIGNVIVNILLVQLAVLPSYFDCVGSENNLN